MIEIHITQSSGSMVSLDNKDVFAIGPEKIGAISQSLSCMYVPYWHQNTSTVQNFKDRE